MNPIFQWVMTHTIVKSLVRRCPKCHQDQIVPQDKNQESIPCKKCGFPIPPKKSQG